MGGARFLGYHSLWEEALHHHLQQSKEECQGTRERARGEEAEGSDLFQGTVIGDVYPASTGTLE